jgi:hypothetical protein
MRAMQACATAFALFVGLLAAPVVFSACASGAAPPPNPPGADVPPPLASASAAATAAVDIAPTAAAPKPSVPRNSTADCKAMIGEITNEPPPGAVALNNAMTSKDAGATDRLEPLTELVRSKRDSFRCCFDVWAKDHPGAAGSAKMVVKLKADGTVTSVEFEDTANRLSDVEPCMAEVARALSYPRSPSGKETKFRYPFDFKARH